MIDVGEFEYRNKYKGREGTRPIAHCLLAELRRQCIECECSTGVITDEVASIFYEQTTLDPNPSGVCVEILSTGYSVRMALASLIWNDGHRCGLCVLNPGESFRPLLGVSNHFEGIPPSVTFDVSELLQNYRRCEDFDIYTMQRNMVEWSKFNIWKAYARDRAKRTPLVRGSVLGIIPDAFFELHTPRRSLYPSLQIPIETRNILASQGRRPRDAKVDQRLHQTDSSQSLTFEITRVIRSGPDHWSQVFVGRLSDTSSESLICLKLFDDRHFHLPIPPSFHANSRPEMQLLTLHTASDMILNEESIYHRCSHFQGLLLPHCYGFHEVRTCQILDTRLLTYHLTVHTSGWLALFWAFDGTDPRPYA